MLEEVPLRKPGSQEKKREGTKNVVLVKSCVPSDKRSHDLILNLSLAEPTPESSQSVRGFLRDVLVDAFKIFQRAPRRNSRTFWGPRPWAVGF